MINHHAQLHGLRSSFENSSVLHPELQSEPLPCQEKAVQVCAETLPSF